MPYFDYNATTPPLPAALAAARETAEQAGHKPSSPYRASASAHALLDEARYQRYWNPGSSKAAYKDRGAVTHAAQGVCDGRSNFVNHGAESRSQAQARSHTRQGKCRQVVLPNW